MDDLNEIDYAVESMSGARLDIGCGRNKQPGFFGVDIQKLPGVDMVWDINRHPWPLKPGIFLMAMCSHLIEHIPTVVIDGGVTRFPFIEFMDEVWRLLKPGGEFMIACPHGNSQGFLQDPTHCHALNQTTFAYFDPLEANGVLYNFYKPQPWRVKYLTYNPSANIECVLVKRRMFISDDGEVRYE